MCESTGLTRQTPRRACSAGVRAAGAGGDILPRAEEQRTRSLASHLPIPAAGSALPSASPKADQVSPIPSSTALQHHCHWGGGGRKGDTSRIQGRISGRLRRCGRGEGADFPACWGGKGGRVLRGGPSLWRPRADFLPSPPCGGFIGPEAGTPCEPLALLVCACVILSAFAFSFHNFREEAFMQYMRSVRESLLLCRPKRPKLTD